MKRSRKLIGIVFMSVILLFFAGLRAGYAEERNQGVSIQGVGTDDSGFVNGYGRKTRLKVSALEGSQGGGVKLYGISGPYQEECSPGDYSYQEENEFVIKENGFYYICALDEAQNSDVICLKISCIDRQGPERKEMIVTADRSANGYSRSISLSPVLEDEAGLAAAPYSYNDGRSFTSVSENTYYENCIVKLCYRDVLGNESRDEVEIACIDRQAPYVTLTDATERINGYALAARCHAEAADYQSLLDEEAYSLDRLQWTDTDQFDFEAEGEYDIYVRDSLGNVAAESFRAAGIDRDAPVIKSINKSMDKEVSGYTDTLILEIEAEDEKSGLAAMPYCLGENSYSEKNTFDIVENGIYAISVRDALGNVQEAAVNIECIDNEGPVIYISGNPSEYTNGDISLILTVSDSMSGISGLWYKNDSYTSRLLIGNYDNLDNVCEKLKISQNGSYTFYAQDGLGNMSEATVRVTKINKSSSSSKSTSSSKRSSSSYSSRISDLLIIGSSSSKKTSSSSVARLIIGSVESSSPEGDDEEEEAEEEEDMDYEDGELIYSNMDSLSLNMTSPLDGMDDIFPEYIEGEYDTAYGAPEIKDIDYPAPKEEGVSKGAILAMGTLIIILLSGLVLFLLNKFGILDLKQLLLDLTHKGQEMQEEEMAEETTDEF